MSDYDRLIRVLLADDHALFRDGVASLLEGDGRFQLVGQAADGAQAVKLSGELRPDVVLMDIQMPGMTGLEATRRLMASQPDLKIIMLTISDKDADLFEAIKAGAQGYLLKMTTTGRQLVESVARVAAGEALIAPTMVLRLLVEFAALSQTAQEGKGAEEEVITLRERQVLELVAEGLVNKEIAARLTVSENTVRTHLRNILDKLHMHSRVQAALWLRQHKGSP